MASATEALVKHGVPINTLLAFYRGLINTLLAFYSGLSLLKRPIGLNSFVLAQVKGRFHATSHF